MGREPEKRRREEADDSWQGRPSSSRRDVETCYRAEVTPELSGDDLVTERSCGGCGRPRPLSRGESGRPTVTAAGVTSVPRSNFSPVCLSCAAARFPAQRHAARPTRRLWRWRSTLSASFAAWAVDVTRRLPLTWPIAAPSDDVARAIVRAVASSGSSLREAICDRLWRWSSALSAPFAYGGR